jgi:hypothetical protein
VGRAINLCRLTNTEVNVCTSIPLLLNRVDRDDVACLMITGYFGNHWPNYTTSHPRRFESEIV